MLAHFTSGLLAGFSLNGTLDTILAGIIFELYFWEVSRALMGATAPEFSKAAKIFGQFLSLIEAAE